MRCDEIDRLLDAMMDGELTAGEQSELEEHARVCPQCAEKLNATRQLKAILGDALPEADVPLAAQAGWRNAVRAEAARTKRKSWYRWVSGAAAALVVLVGVGLALRGSIRLNAPSRDVQSAVVAARTAEETADAGMMEEAADSVMDDVIDGDILAGGGAVLEEAMPVSEAPKAMANEMMADEAMIADEEIAEVEIMGDGDAAYYDAPLSMMAMVEADGPGAQSDESAVRSAPMRERRMSVENLDAACKTVRDLVDEYEGTVDEQPFEDNGAAGATGAAGAAGINLYVSLPTGNVADFLNAIAHLDVSGEELSWSGPDDGGQTSLLLVLKQAK